MYFRAVSLVIKSGDVRQDFFFPLCCLNKQVYWLKTGEAILRACEPEPLFASLKRFPPKNPKTGIMPYYGIYYMRGTSYMRIPEELSIKPRQPKGIETLIITTLIPFPNSLHKRSRAVNRFVKNGKANFGSPIEGNPKYSG